MDTAPVNGTYTGSALEWNVNGKVTQDVTSTLFFNYDGFVEGSGNDALDGSYTIKGEWRINDNGNVKVRWREIYEDFSVIVVGDLLEEWKKSKIKGTFHSSRSKNRMERIYIGISQ